MTLELDPMSRQKRVALRMADNARKRRANLRAKCFSPDPAVRRWARYLATNGNLEGFKP